MPFAREGPCRALALGPLSGAMVAVKVLVGRVMGPPRALLSRLRRGTRRVDVRLEPGGGLFVVGVVARGVVGARYEELVTLVLLDVVDV